MKLERKIAEIAMDYLVIDGLDLTQWLIKWKKCFLVVEDQSSNRNQCDFDYLRDGFRSLDAIGQFTEMRLQTQDYYIREQLGAKELVYLCSGHPPPYEILKKILPSSDVYITDSDFTYVFALTHEDEMICGPLFYKKKSKAF